MSTKSTIININEIHDVFKEHYEEKNIKFSKNEFEKFLDCCERDFYQWLNDNLKYFTTKHN
jgi:succinate dehydrogenase flavin-adding protein (antitoxin of CptAB toxin-antitoxin module)